MGRFLPDSGGLRTMASFGRQRARCGSRLGCLPFRRSGGQTEKDIRGSQKNFAKGFILVKNPLSFR